MLQTINSYLNFSLLKNSVVHGFSEIVTSTFDLSLNWKLKIAK